jgi:hypothetical protein
MKEPTPAEVRRVMSSLGKKGGPARAESMTPEKRKAIAQKAAEARWGPKKAVKKTVKKASK